MTAPARRRASRLPSRPLLAALAGTLALAAAVPQDAAPAPAPAPAPASQDAAPAPLALAALDWMAGSWRAAHGSASSEEHWLPAAGGLMLGLHRDVDEARGRASFEFLRIEARPTGLVYVAQPGGRAPTDFALVEHGEQRVVFANPEHDFPQRLVYWRDGEALLARAEGADGQGPQWRWERVERPLHEAPAH